jgi:NAD(P)-dependent dehydrogenase (short-subunit alcohol dehydrogenase family)
VIFAGRDEVKTMAVINSIQDPAQKENAIFLKLDLSNFESMKNFANKFETSIGGLDVLVNNAGGFFDTFEMKEGIESTIMINHIGPTFLTALLLPLLNPEGLVVNLSSGMHLMVNQAKFDEYMQTTDFNQTGPAGNAAFNYAFTKLCNVLHAIHLDNYARKNSLKFKSASLHPGAVASEFQLRSTTTFYKALCFCMMPFRFLLFKDTKMGAQTTLHVIYSDYYKLNSGAYFNNCAEEGKNSICHDSMNVAKLMQYSKNLIVKNLRNVPKEVERFFADL